MELGAENFQLIALLPGNLQGIFGDRGAEYFGIVQAVDGGWCWSFHADGVDQRSKVFPSKIDAEVDLSWIHLSPYPIWLNPGERAGHLCNLMRRRDEHRALEDMAASATLGFARQHFELAITGLAAAFRVGDNGIRLPA